MSAMENMIKNMLLSALPPEVMGLMTKENMDAVVMKATAFVEQQDLIFTSVTKNTETLEEILSYVSGSRKPGRGAAKLPITAD